ncbi:hypothetical protein ACHWQZ_G000473 [Mnemiopsis leidyi]
MLREFLCLFFIASSVDGKKGGMPTHEDLYEYSTDEAVVYAKPVVINAKKMHKALKHQDIVSTCRYILFKTFKKFWDAERSCKNIHMPLTHKNGSIAVIKTKEDNKDITHLLQLAYGVRRVGKKFDRRNWVWVGLQKVKDNKRRLKKNEQGPKNFKPDEWRWVDGTQPEYTRWMKKMPDQEKAGKHYQDHVSVNKRGQWDDTFPFKEMPYACNYCGKYIVIPRHARWYEARNHCKTFGLTLAIVNSKEENDELYQAAVMAMGAETGQKRWNDTNWIWIGTQEVMKNNTGTGEWEHHDGTALQWKQPHWDRKLQPDNWTKRLWGEQRVVAFSRINKRWDDSYPQRERPYACMCPLTSCQSNVYEH